MFPIHSSRHLFRQSSTRAKNSDSSWKLSAWESACQEALAPILQAERFFRRGLHYDNPLLRPLRDALVKLTPASLLAGKVRQRLHL